MQAPQDLEGFRSALSALPQPDAAALEAAMARNAQLTKPQGALGQLESLAIWYASWRGVAAPRIEAPQIAVFAANHGVAARGVSAFPAEVTAQMVANFAAGGAAINQLAKAFGAALTVHAFDLQVPTADFTEAPAMTEAELVAALQTGWTALGAETDLLILGEMGIGNTTAAAAIVAALFGGGIGPWVGRGTGVDAAGLARKAAAVEAAIARHQPVLDDPLQVLRCLGGFEIAAMTGALLAARLKRVPVILDGFICTTAASVLYQVTPAALEHCIAGHVSAEAAHRDVLARLRLEPVLNLGLRLGEGSGAAVALGVLQAALACHSGMATFGEAGVSESG